MIRVTPSLPNDPAVEEPLCLIAGRGQLPRYVHQRLQAQGLAPRLIAIAGFFDDPSLSPDASVPIDKFGQLADALAKWQIRSVAFVGKIDRPSLLSLRPDAMLLRLLPRLGLATLGDDAVLRRLMTVFEKEFHVTVISPQTLLGQHWLPGCLGRHHPDQAAQDDIVRGLEVLRVMSSADFGQTVAVESGVVLGLEAIEGTDQLIRRCGEFKKKFGQGVVVKMPKIQQDMRIDAPVIGLETISSLVESGFGGISFSAADTMILDHKAVIETANRAGLFLNALEWKGHAP